MTAEHVPVVVVGAGPVGITTALLLARLGVASVVLERHPEAYPLPRAVHLDDEVLRILQAVGVADAFAAISRPMPGMRLVDGRHRTMAQFRRDEVVGHNGWPRANMFDQPDLERLLLAAASREPLVEVRRGCEVTGIDVEQALVRYERDGTSQEVSGDWVVGCDGANSTVRSAIGAAFVDLGFEERWLVVDGRTSSPLGDWGGVDQVCDPRRAATFMHVVGDRYRWEFRLADDETADDLLGQLPALLQPWTAGVDVAVVRHAEYTFRARVADGWRNGRVLLAGDAAHQTPPFVGQGLGAGLRDAGNLSWKIATHLATGVDLLDTYEAERRPHATRVIRAAIMIGWALTGGQDTAAAARRLALAAFCRVPGFAARAGDTSSPRLPSGPLLRRRPGDRVVGVTFPQPAPGFDDLLGRGWCVVSRGPVATTLPVVSVSADEPASAAVRDWLSGARAYAVLVRPDRIVAAVARRPSEIAALDGLVPAAIPTADRHRKWPRSAANQASASSAALAAPPVSGQGGDRPEHARDDDGGSEPLRPVLSRSHALLPTGEQRDQRDQ